MANKVKSLERRAKGGDPQALSELEARAKRLEQAALKDPKLVGKLEETRGLISEVMRVLDERQNVSAAAAKASALQRENRVDQPATDNFETPAAVLARRQKRAAAELAGGFGSDVGYVPIDRSRMASSVQTVGRFMVVGRELAEISRSQVTTPVRYSWQAECVTTVYQIVSRDEDALPIGFSQSPSPNFETPEAAVDYIKKKLNGKLCLTTNAEPGKWRPGQRIAVVFGPDAVIKYSIICQSKNAFVVKEGDIPFMSDMDGATVIPGSLQQVRGEINRRQSAEERRQSGLEEARQTALQRGGRRDDYFF